MQSTEELATTVDGWVKGLATLHARIGRHFVRAEPRQHALLYLKGLLAPNVRKNATCEIASQDSSHRPSFPSRN